MKMFWMRKIGLFLTAMLVLIISCNPVAAGTPTILAGTWATAVNGDADLLILATPVDVQAGDLLLAQIAYEKGIDALPITPPSGWIHIGTTNAYQGGGYKDIGQALYWKYATDSEAVQHVWRFQQKVEALGGIIRYRGVDLVDPIGSFEGRGGYGESTGLNQITAPALEGRRGDRLVSLFALKELARLETPVGSERRFEVHDRDNDYSTLLVDELVGETTRTQERTSLSWEYDDPTESVEAEWVAQSIILRARISGSVSAGQTRDEIRVYIDGTRLSLIEKPFIEHSRTLIPMRAFFEAVGADVTWDAVNRIAMGIRGSTVIRIPIGSTMPTVNDVTREIEVAARIVNARTYVPLRFVGEALGHLVIWDGLTQSIFITTR